MSGRVRVCLEIGKTRAFASALDWPGWCRSGKREELALEGLTAVAGRYAEIAREAGLALPPGEGEGFEVVERVIGDATTDFGAPGRMAGADREPLSPAEAKRLAALVGAAWRVFDRVVAGAPQELRKGPRGGGRDRDKVVEHVLAAEVSYARSLGLKIRQPDVGDADVIAAERRAILDAIEGGEDGRWPRRYAARRIAWHVVDHAWEIEDRAS